MITEDCRAELDRFKKLSVGVIGDIALDAYWMLDGDLGEISVETGKRAFAVREHRYSLGGGGNIIANLAALGVGHVMAFGVVGDDIFGHRLLTLLEQTGADTSGMVTQRGHWDTPVWIKPHLEDQEQRRIDFSLFNELAPPTREDLLARTLRSLESLDALIVNQQLPNPLVSGPVIEDLNGLPARFPKVTFIVDSRDFIRDFPHMVLKFNDKSLLRETGMAQASGESAAVSVEEIRAALAQLFPGHPRPIVVTRGWRGCVVCEKDGLTAVPGVYVPGPVDTVGAGDTMLAAFTASLAAGLPPVRAAELGNWASAVTVSKLRQTGTANPEEIAALARDGYLVHSADLAEDERLARYLPGTRIELVSQNLTRGKISHAIFDHDGTISTLRQGWEPIMERMMVRSILGPAFDSVTSGEYHRVVGRVTAFIDESTGVQTIVQMHGLVDMVREFGYVPEKNILDAPAYKAIYNEELLAVVRKRLERLEAGELDTGDFTIKGAVSFLHTVCGQGVACYLASGTDIGDVRNEARTLGYLDCFQDRVFGSVGDINKFSKKMLVASILRDFNLQGPQLVCFGDGPVEIRETKKKGGIAVGLATDEVRRFGLNPAKRKRLIKAGADIIIPDFTQAARLLEYLKG